MTESKLENDSYIFIITTPRFSNIGLFRLGKYDNPEDIKLLNLAINDPDIKIDDQYITYACPCDSINFTHKFNLLYEILKYFHPVDASFNGKSFEYFGLTNSKEWFIFDYQDLRRTISEVCSFKENCNLNDAIKKVFRHIQKKHEEDIFNMTQE